MGKIQCREESKRVLFVDAELSVREKEKEGGGRERFRTLWQTQTEVNLVLASEH